MNDLEIYQLNWKILKKYSWMPKKKNTHKNMSVSLFHVKQSVYVYTCVCVCELLYEHKNTEKYKLGC